MSMISCNQISVHLLQFLKMIFEDFKQNLKTSILNHFVVNSQDFILDLIATSKQINYENDYKIVVDTVLREILLYNLASSNHLDYDCLKKFLNLTVLMAKNEYCSINTPIVLLGELLDCRTLKECETLFTLIDENITVWKDEFFFKNVKNHLLRTCNDLLRRLSRNQNTVFCGRILIFLANFFPLFERSGLNLTSEFNQDNSFAYSVQDEETLKENEAQNNGNKEITDPNDRELKIDIDFYKKFWQLQEFFRNPTISYHKDKFKNLRNYCDDVLSVFAGYKMDPDSCFYFQALGLDSNDESKYFVKYLTNQKLLELQLSDSNFRRHILIQILIILQYFTSNVKFRIIDNSILNEEQLSWINQTRLKVVELIEETPPNGKEVRQVIEHLLKREEFWNNWKNEGCAELKEIIESEEISKKSEEYIRSTYTSIRKARLGEHVKNANDSGKILIANSEMNRLWNFCPDNLEACRSQRRIFTPTIEQFFEPVLKTLPENRKFHCSESNFCWKSLRLLAEKSSYFFVPNNQMVKSVNDYLEGVIENLSNDYNISVPKANVDNEDNKTETEDISDDELLKNVDSNSVKSNEDDTIEGLDGNANDNVNPSSNHNTAIINNNDAMVTTPENVLTENIIEQIASKIANFWDELSPLFGFQDDEIDYIRETYPDPFARIKHLITIWKDEQGPEEGNLFNLKKIINSVKPNLL
ncbi:THO complex subunit 1 [Sarcoptes scabiei]|uniref:THO complex subunit 1 n=1 Tax=Sarcoptes scabiei TaxID=52283 RepID=A0A834R0E6_SARSC|nr:THO complex subunit 1 [Sarcoptes scabiei]